LSHSNYLGPAEGPTISLRYLSFHLQRLLLEGIRNIWFLSVVVKLLPVGNAGELNREATANREQVLFTPGRTVESNLTSEPPLPLPILFHRGENELATDW
jgi:hypothetical protein